MPDCYQSLFDFSCFNKQGCLIDKDKFIHLKFITVFVETQ